MSLAAAHWTKRAAATAIDCLLLLVPYGLALTDAAPQPARVAAAAAVLIAMGIQAFMLARSGQTLGKRIMRHRVVSRSTGENAGFLTGAVARPLAAWAPNVVFLSLRAFPLWLLADGLTLLLRSDGLSLHDLLCGTRVVDSSAETDARI